MNSIRKAILQHTRPSRRHLTPELVLRLITPDCPLWSAPADRSPWEDPFWAFYWPGGQATARYILDNPQIVRNRRVLDVGCGCGAGAIAASAMQASYVVANDIDPNAVVVTEMNNELNNTSLETSTNNYIGSDCDEFDVILIGDMFYDEVFGRELFRWLQRLANRGKMVLIGDPGRHGLTTRRRRLLAPLATYRLPPDTCLENHGFTDTTLWKLNKL